MTEQKFIYSEKQNLNPHLSVNLISKTFGSFAAIKNVTFNIYEGELVCILGPSGCGKTTLLRVIAGLDVQDSGTIIQSNQNVSSLPPDKRDYGIVFQTYALFPNLTVKKNISYGLETRNTSDKKIEERVSELLKLTGLNKHANKYPAQLSGGEQQRVALARALAPSPGLLLLDEPLSALDAKVRIYLRKQIKDLQRKLGVTTIMVTHDQEEALTMADRIVIMNQGIVEQIGHPIDIYQKPRTPFVANFIGTTNFMHGKILSNNKVEVLGSSFLCLIEDKYSNEIILTIRPEDILINSTTVAENMFEGKIIGLEFLGFYFKTTLSIIMKNGKLTINGNLSIQFINNNKLQLNDNVTVTFPKNNLRIYSKNYNDRHDYN